MNSNTVEESLYRLNQIGIALSSQQDLKKLLEMILSEARNLTHGEAGTLYLVEGDKLRFVLAQNEVLDKLRGPTPKGGKQSPFEGKAIPLTKQSLAGYVAITGKVLNIPDAYEIPEDAPYHFDKTFDIQNRYRTSSLLLAPLREPSGKVFGVLQLINARNEEDEVVQFSKQYEPLIASLSSQAAVAVRNAQLTENLKKAYLDTIFRLAVAAEYRDDDTAAHLKRMSTYSSIIARNYGLDDVQVENVLYASPMHDVGKLGIPDAILQKPGKLTEEEFAVMRQHTVIGAKILANSEAEVLQLAEVVALTHHEKYDGTGYPRGLQGEQIPLVGRIVAIADVFDALTSKRCYKPAFPVEKALAIMEEGRGKHFDPKLLDLFKDALDEVLKIREKYVDA